MTFSIFFMFSQVCGLLGFSILSMRLWYFVQTNVNAKRKVQQGEQAFPPNEDGSPEDKISTDGMPWKLADRMDWVSGLS